MMPLGTPVVPDVYIKDTIALGPSARSRSDAGNDAAFSFVNIGVAIHTPLYVSFGVTFAYSRPDSSTYLYECTAFPCASSPSPSCSPSPSPTPQTYIHFEDMHKDLRNALRVSILFVYLPNCILTDLYFTISRKFWG